MDGDRITLEDSLSLADFRRMMPSQANASAASLDLALRATDATRTSCAFLQRDLSDTALNEPLPESFSDDDLARARREGFQEGFAAAHAEAAASRAAAETMTLAAVAGAMADARRGVIDVSQRTAWAMAKAVGVAMRATVPALVRRSAGLETSALVAHILPGLAREPTIAIEVAPDLVAGISQKMSTLPEMQRGGITVNGVPGLAYGDARIFWGTGEARREPYVVWRQIMSAFAQEHLDDSIEQEDPNHGE
jgi:flagellar biosynthesis/type III secretory pathway protein FliH